MSSWRTARSEIRTLSIRRRVFAECPRTVRQNPKNRKSSLRLSSKSDWMVVF